MFGDDFQPIFMFFFHLNEPRTGRFETEEEDQDHKELDEDLEDDQG